MARKKGTKKHIIPEIIEIPTISEKTELEKHLEIYEFLISRGIHSISSLEVKINQLNQIKE